MSQKKVLAHLVASLLLAMNVVYADTAILVAEGVLVEKNPEIQAPTEETPEGTVAQAEPPAQIGSAKDASYVSTGGWAVTGSKFIDAAAVVFNFGSTASVSEAMLSLPLEEVFEQDGTRSARNFHLFR